MQQLTLMQLPKKLKPKPKPKVFDEELLFRLRFLRRRCESNEAFLHLLVQSRNDVT